MLFYCVSFIIILKSLHHNFPEKEVVNNMSLFFYEIPFLIKFFNFLLRFAKTST